MRDITERPEALSTGVVKLVGSDPDVIEREVARLLDDADHYRATARAVFPYGDGTAATQIATIIESDPFVETLSKSLASNQNVRKVDASTALREADIAVLLVSHGQFRQIEAN